MSVDDEVWRLDATAQADLVRRREASPGELLDAAIARIERLNPQINAVITPLYDLAREQAAQADFGAPFAGVPMLVKDACLQIEGTPYYLGLGAMRDAGYRSDHTTELARRFRSAGFLIAGKTNVPELSATASTEPPAFGPTRNPWDTARTPGGSSGGSAAAVTAGMVALAHGVDGGGSLRYPAACCGVATLRPSRGRVPSETPTGEPDALGMWSEFVLARSVRDLAAVLDAVAGPAPGDTIAAPPPARPYVNELRAPTAPLRVGLLTKDVMSGMAADPECVSAVERTGDALSALGHAVDQAHPPALDGMILRLWPTLSAVLAVGRPPLFRWISRSIGRELTQDDLREPLVADQDVANIPASRYAEGLVAILREAAALRSWWTEDEGHDLLITPVLRQPPWLLGGNGGAEDAGVFPFPFSLSGQPAMSLPLHWTPASLPVGVQLVAAYGREDLLFNVASQLEEAMPWKDRWPAIAAS